MDAARACSTPGCTLRFVSGRHTHCCSLCHNTHGASHSRRCSRHQRWLSRPDRIGDRPRVGRCSVAGCGRLTGGSHGTCCSRCSPTLGHRHSCRCDRLHHEHAQLPAPPAGGHEHRASSGSASQSVPVIVTGDTDKPSGLGSVCGGGHGSGSGTGSGTGSASASSRDNFLDQMD